jgi:cytochrome P450
MISSFLAQRDLTRFPEPRLFSPDRWLDLRPTPFEFFPFGAGVRACLGASLARAVLRTTVAELVTRGTLSLAFDTRVGWQMPDALMPSTGVPVLLRASADDSFGRARGPICEIVDFAPLAP